MTLHFTVRCHRIQGETEIHKFEQIHRRDTCLHQMVKYLIIFGNRFHNPALVHPPGLDLSIIVPVPAAVAAELLIRPSVLDLMSALKTDWDTSGNFLINHTPEFYMANLSLPALRRNSPATCFSFSLRRFFSFL